MSPHVVTRTWVDLTRSAMRGALVVLAVLNFTTAVTFMASEVDLTHFHCMLGLGLVVVQQIYQVWGMWWSRNQFIVTAVSLSLLLLGSALLALHSSAEGLRRAWFFSPLATTTIGVLALIRSKYRWNVVLVVLLANIALRVWTWPGGAGQVGLTQTLVVETGRLAAFGAVAVIGCSRVFAAAKSIDTALQIGLQQRTAAQLARTRAARAREVDRFVHDEVLHGLRTIAMERSAVPAAQAQAAATNLNALLATEATRTPVITDTGLVARLREVADSSSLQVQVSGPSDLVLPDEVSHAFETAVREAIRNVERHAETGSVWIRINYEQLRVTCRIIDTGRGFAPDRAARGHGVSSSILARMRDVEGAADVASSPGEGTTVTLTWSPLPTIKQRPGTLGHGAMSDIFPSLSTTMMPLLLMSPWFAIWQAWELPHPIALIAMSALLPLVGWFTIRVGVRNAGLSWVQAAAVIGFAVVCAAVGGWSLPTEQSNFNLYWLAFGSSVLIAILSFLRPLRDCFILGGLLFLVIWSFTSWAEGTWFNTAYTNALLAPATMTLPALAVRFAIDQSTWDILRSDVASAQAAAASLAEGEFSHELRTRLNPLRLPLETFLADIVANPESVSDPVVRRRAASLERDTRELLMSSQTGLLQRISHLRSEGWTVTLRATQGLPVSVESVAIEALRLLSAAATAPRSVTVTAAELDDQWRLSLLVLPDVRQDLDWLTRWVDLLSETGWSCSVDEHGTHAVIRVGPSKPRLSAAVVHGGQ
mgnify:CR=1 FL=1